jgi:hypothetical protein
MAPSNKSISALKQINVLAHKIQKKHPKKVWKECIKQAGMEYRKGKKSK